MKNKGTEYLQKLRINKTVDSTIFMNVEGMDEPYVRLSHAEEATRIAFQGVFDDKETIKTKIEVLQFITSSAVSNISIKSCIAYAKNKQEAILNLQVLRNNVLSALDALNRMDKEPECVLID